MKPLSTTAWSRAGIQQKFSHSIAECWSGSSTAATGRLATPVHAA